MITEIEQQTSDIDWFFINGDEVGFVASGGGILPGSVANKSIEEIVFIADYFRRLPQKGGVVINPDLKKFISADSINNEYLACFVEMAERGLFSFDKTVLNRFSDTNYHLVAKPLNPVKFNNLPLEIIKLLVGTKINGDMETTLNISLIE